jgi:hypothetical protein
MFGKGHMLLHRTTFKLFHPLRIFGVGHSREIEIEKGKDKLLFVFSISFINLHSSNVRNLSNPPCVSTLMITSTMTSIILIRNGLVEQDGRGRTNRPPMIYRLTEMGWMQAENMAARHTMVNLQTGIVSSPGSGGGSPESEGGQNNRRMWAGNLVFDPRSIRRPANLRYG